MNRLLRFGVAGVAGLVAGGGTMLVIQGGSDLADSSPPPPPSLELAEPEGDEPAPDSTTTTAAPGPEVVLAWTAGGLPAGFAATVDALGGTDRTAVVRGDLIGMTGATDPSGQPAGEPPTPGMVVPLDAISIDTATYPTFVSGSDRQAFRRLAPGEAIIGETSARLRDLGPGGHISIAGGTTITVAAVVPDPLVGAAELVVSNATGPEIGVTTERYVLATAAGSPDDAASEIRSAADPSVRLRVRRPGETPYLRSSDAVLPQARIKDVFGEFAYVAPVGVREIRQDPEWVTANIVTAEIPIIGRVRCHRGLVPALRGAMQELADRNLASLIDDDQGCYNPRLISVGGDLSRHAWGAAIDLNFGGNPTGSAGIQDPRLVAVMERWGFGSGDDWLVPDPGHFEYIGPPDP